MVEQGIVASSERQPPPQGAHAAASLGPAPARWIPTRRGPLVVAGVIALAVVALALGRSLGTILLVGLVPLCALMMVAMMFGMHRMPWMPSGDRGHGHSDDRPAAGTRGASGGRALDILGERYARGELTSEQYEQMRHDLAIGADRAGTAPAGTPADRAAAERL
jgi:uncharacterized membrane protein